MPSSHDHATHSHDGFFNFVFTHPEEAIGFLNAYLPEPLPGICDWGSLEILPTAFTSQRLGKSHGDILYRIRVGDVETWVHIIVEHQSSHSKVPMPYRCQKYMTQGWEAPSNHVTTSSTKTKPRRRKSGPTFPLPHVVAFLVHQGETPYTGPTSFRELLASTGNPDADDILARYSPQFEIIVIDLADPKTRLAGTAIGKAALELMAAVRRGEGAAFLEAHKQKLDTDLERIAVAIFSYLISTPSGVTYPQIETTISELNNPLKGKTMTIAQQLRQEGQLSMQHADILEALKIRFKRVPSGLREAVQSIDSPRKLHALLRAAITSPSLEAFAENL